MQFGYATTFQSLDKGLIEKVGPTGFVGSVFNASSNFLSYSTGYPYKAIYVLVCFAFVFVSLYFAAMFGLQSTISMTFGLLVFSFLVASLYNPVSYA
jgi:hypothetical protein